MIKRHRIICILLVLCTISVSVIGHAESWICPTCGCTNEGNNCSLCNYSRPSAGPRLLSNGSVSFLDIPLLSSSFKSQGRETGTFKDKIGNTYENCICYCVGNRDSEDVYYLGKNYSSFSGTIFVPEKRPSHEDEQLGLRIIVYGDGKRIYTSPQMQSLSIIPVDFSIDVRGIEKLSIRYLGGTWTNQRQIGLTNLYLVPVSNDADRNYVSMLPDRLMDINTLENGFSSETEYVLSDKYGNVYTDCVELNDFSDRECRIIFATLNKYSRLTGTIFVPKDRFGDDYYHPGDDEYIVRIYGDEKKQRLLYESPAMTEYATPVSFDIDISGVQLLCITYHGYTMTLMDFSGSIGLADLLLYK